MPFVSAVISAGANLIGSSMAADATEDAASTLSNAATAAGAKSAEAQRTAATDLAKAYTESGVPLSEAALKASEQKAAGALAGGEAVAGALSPYTGLGAQAAQILGDGFQQGGQFNRPFTMADATNSEAMKTAIEQGSLAVQNSAAARSGLLNSNAMQGVLETGQKLGSMYQGQAFDQWLQTMKTTLGGLEGILGVGRSAAGQAGTAQGNAQDAAATAQAAGTLGSAQALQGTKLDAAKALATGNVGAANTEAEAAMAAAGAQAQGGAGSAEIWANLAKSVGSDFGSAYTANQVLKNREDPLFKMSDMSMGTPSYSLGGSGVKLGG